MFDRKNPRIIWVAPGTSEGEGTWEQPYTTIARAIERVQPGYTIVLKSGHYTGDQTIEVSGTVEMPIQITGDEDAVAEIREGCWYFYDTSDLIIANLTFRDAPYGAVSVIGLCERNRYEQLQFVNCGTSKKSAITFYFGGSGGNCNVVENCVFDHMAVEPGTPAGQDVSVGLMISEGDREGGALIRHHIVRRNRFVNYGYGILVGTGDHDGTQHGHTIEYNRIEHCGTEGVLVKCGDTQVRGNVVRNCLRNSIAVTSGTCSVIEDNRIIDCAAGIQVHGPGHTIANNCIIRTGGEALRACGAAGDAQAATNLFIENNTIVGCSAGAAEAAGIRIDRGTTCIIQRNLVHGPGKPYLFVNNAGGTGESSCVIADNIIAGGGTLLDGFAGSEVTFCDAGSDNYENDSGYGAHGWMLRPEGIDPNLDDADDEGEYREASVLINDKGELILPGDEDGEALYSSYEQLNSLLLGDEDEEDSQEE
jgi:hypothetical protein